jgi:anti-anti-sigma regulatory factor
VYGIGVREWGEGGVLVELEGEFDQHNLEDLQEALSNVVSLRRPTWVDLYGVTFLDVGATRELTIHSRLYAHHLSLCNPSWQVRASVAACGFEGWIDPNYRQSNVSDQLKLDADGTSPDEEALPA